MDLSILMRKLYSVKQRYATRLKYEGKFLTFQTKLVPEGKASIYSTIKGNLRLYCRKFSRFVVAVII